MNDGNWVEKEKGAEVIRALFATYFQRSKFERLIGRDLEIYIRNAIRHLRKNKVARGLDKVFHRGTSTAAALRTKGAPRTIWMFTDRDI